VTFNDIGTYNCTATTHDKKVSSAGIDIQVYGNIFSYIAVCSAENVFVMKAMRLCIVVRNILLFHKTVNTPLMQ